jgi:hypothetical protein
MTNVSTRRTLVALAATATLLPAAPALAQTSTSSATVPVTAAPTRVQLVPPRIDVDRRVIDYGRTHGLNVFAPVGDIGRHVQLWANTLPNRTPRLIREAVLVATEQDAVAIAGWVLQPGATTTYSVVVNGARSATTTVQVRRSVSIGVRETDRAYTFSGHIASPVAGLQVTVARLDAATKRVTGVASTRTTADGHYAIRTSLPVGRAGYYALTSATSDLQAGRSRLYGLVVPAPSRTGP